MAIVVVLFPDGSDEPTLEPARLEELSKLGVTSVSLVRDASAAGLVLEGWAFDPRDADRAARAVAGEREGVRTLQPLVQMGVSAVALTGGDVK